MTKHQTPFQSFGGARNQEEDSPPEEAGSDRTLGLDGLDLSLGDRPVKS